MPPWLVIVTAAFAPGFHPADCERVTAAIHAALQEQGIPVNVQSKCEPYPVPTPAIRVPHSALPPPPVGE